MKPQTKLWIELVLWIALPATYWAYLQLAPVYYPPLSWECLVGYLVIFVAIGQVKSRWRRL